MMLLWLRTTSMHELSYTRLCIDVAKSLGAPVEPDCCALAALAARRALHLVAACMHVPAVHASMLEQSGLLQPPSTAQAVMVLSCTAYSLHEAHHLCAASQSPLIHYAPTHTCTAQQL